MFGLLPARPPLTSRQRAEIELLMREAVAAVGPEPIREAAVIRAWTDLKLDLTDPQTLLTSAGAEVCKRMRLADANVQFEISDEQTLQGPSNYHSGAQPIIAIAIETLRDPLRTVTGLAHECGHHVLLGDRVPRDTDFDDRLTDLIALCHGFGVLQSDASLYVDAWSVGEWSGWQASKSGHLNAQEIGYALALFARVRSESGPSWRRALRADSRVTMKQALKHFHWREQRRAPLLFDAERIPGGLSTSRELVDWLTGDDPTFALAAGWRLCAMDQFDLPTIEALHIATRSRDPDLVPLAIGLLAGADERDRATAQRIETLLRDRRPQVAWAAAKAAFGLGMNLSEQIGMLAWLLDKLPAEAVEILQIIASQGSTAVGIETKICGMLPRTIKSLDDRLTSALVDCLVKVSTNPRQAIESTISAGPIRDEALQWLKRAT